MVDENDGGHQDNVRSEASEQLWPMGAVTRRTGIGEHTLRAWERRFGFPNPERLPSGHRRYPADQVRQLILINQALSCGYRAGDVVPLSRERLEAVLVECARAETSAGRQSEAWVRDFLEGARHFDRNGLTVQLSRAASALGVGRFLRARVEPILVELGTAWARGEVQIRHEHFASQVVDDALRSLRLQLEPGAHGRPVVLASLPGEPHALGLQVAALAVVAAGRCVRILGAQSPVEEIVNTAEEIDAIAVGLSISEFSAGGQTAATVNRLREALPAGIELWLGGAGADQLSELPAAVRIVSSLDDLEVATGQLDI